MIRKSLCAGVGAVALSLSACQAPDESAQADIGEESVEDALNYSEERAPEDEFDYQSMSAEEQSEDTAAAAEAE